MNLPDLSLEQQFAAQGYTLICGVDEAGRGPLAGPVCAGAVIWPDGLLVPAQLNDSKKMSAKARDTLYAYITANCVCATAMADEHEIEQHNILGAALLAMRRAVEALPAAPDIALVDGNQPPTLPCAVRTYVGGDSLSVSIAAASVLAKVTRDAHMLLLDEQYPFYGFARHKGYGTAAHRAAIEAHGLCPAHRRSFIHAAKAKTEKQMIGRTGEAIAARYLTRHGYRVLGKNIALNGGEIDIVALNGETLCFVEVKTRADNALQRGAAAVDAEKQRKLIAAAKGYLDESLHGELCVRFDVIEVTVNSGKRYALEHIPAAFDASST